MPCGAVSSGKSTTEHSCRCKSSRRNCTPRRESSAIATRPCGHEKSRSPPRGGRRASRGANLLQLRRSPAPSGRSGGDESQATNVEAGAYPAPHIVSNEAIRLREERFPATSLDQVMHLSMSCRVSAPPTCIAASAASPGSFIAALVYVCPVVRGAGPSPTWDHTLRSGSRVAAQPSTATPTR